MTEEYEDIGAFLANSITGQFKVGPPDEMYGPFEDVVTKPMETALGHQAQARTPSSRSHGICATCHVINLPVVDWPLANPPGDTDALMPEEEVEQLLASEKNPNLQGFLHRIEQATYLEWLNSKYQTEFGEPSPDAKSCQDCHMRTEYHSLDGTVQGGPHPDQDRHHRGRELPRRRPPSPARGDHREVPRGGLPAAHLPGPQHLPRGDVQPVQRRPRRPHGRLRDGHERPPLRHRELRAERAREHGGDRDHPVRGRGQTRSRPT